MATSTAKRPPNQPPDKGQVEIIDPRWLLKALGLTLAAAVVLAYLAVCVLVRAGSWQLLLHPSPLVDRTPSIAFQPIRFDAAATGTPRLTGWWIPAESSPARTILFLHDGRGSLSASVRKLELLHQVGVNIFAFDYRGFGQSDPPHASESRMAEDATAALDYLINTRHIPTAQIVPCGEGLGAVLAANLTKRRHELPAVIIDTPDPDAYTRALSTERSRLLPMRLLVHDRFDIATALGGSTRPRLLIADSPFGFETARVSLNQALFRSLPDPKMTVTFDNPRSGDAYVQAVRRFLDEYVPE